MQGGMMDFQLTLPPLLRRAAFGKS